MLGPLSSSLKVGDTLHTTLDPKAQQLARARARRADRRGRGAAARAPARCSRCTPTRRTTPTRPSAWPAPAAATSTAPRRRVSARLDVQDRHRGRGDQHRQVHAESPVNGSSPAVISGVPLSNERRPAARGDQPHLRAHPVDQHRLGAGRRVARDRRDDRVHEAVRLLLRPADRSPQGELRAIRTCSRRRAPPTRPGGPDEDIGRIAIGQGGLSVAPLQMAMVASTIADGGKLMRPHIAARFTNPQGQTVDTIRPRSTTR